MDNYLSDFLLGLAGFAAGFEDDGPVGPHSRSRMGDTPLHYAVIQGNIRAISLLLDAGADIASAGETGYTPLHYAVLHQQLAAVRLLLERGADISLRAETGLTPVELAELLQHHEMNRLLQPHAT
jgi:ankyrin repeat protein